MDNTGDIPPEVEIFHVGVTTTSGLPDPIPSWTEIRVMATANDENPSGGSEGVEMVVLHWQLNSLTANVYSTVMMMAFHLQLQQYVYWADILGQTNGTTVYWWVSAEDVEGNISTTPKRSYLVGTLATDSEVILNKFELIGNYPNPFNPSTNIIYSLNSSSDVMITIHNIRGQIINNLFSGKVNPGEHSVFWNGRDNFSRSLPSGIYIYSIESKGKKLNGKMMLLK